MKLRINSTNIRILPVLFLFVYKKKSGNCFLTDQYKKYSVLKKEKVMSLYVKAICTTQTIVERNIHIRPAIKRAAKVLISLPCLCRPLVS